MMNDTDKLQHWFRRNFGGLWLSASFRRLWLSLTVTSFGAQITNLALPLTAALLLNATPMQMGILVALETLPFALFSLHAGVLLDRVRKLPVIIAADVGRGIALLAIPVAAWFGVLSMEILFAVGFLCGMQNVVGGAAYQVLLAQMAGRKRLVEANAKVTLGETSAALIGPGIAGGLIHVLTAPFAIALDAMTFFASALMLRRIKAPNDVARDGVNGGVWREIGEGLKLVWGNRTLWGLAWLAGIWQFLHHMQVAVLILFATRDLGLSAGAIGLAFVFGGAGLRARVGFGRALVGAVRYRSGDRPRADPVGFRLAGVRPDRRTAVARGLAARDGDAGVRLRRDPVRDQLSVAAAGDHARPAARTHDRDDALCHRRVRADRLAGRRRAGEPDRPARRRCSSSACSGCCCRPPRCSGRRCVGTARCPTR